MSKSKKPARGGGRPPSSAAKSPARKSARPPANSAREPRRESPPARRPSRAGRPSAGKLDDLERERDRAFGTRLTTDHGVPIEHTDDSLKAGPRGPTLLEDFHLREKITRFDHER